MTRATSAAILGAAMLVVVFSATAHAQVTQVTPSARVAVLAPSPTVELTGEVATTPEMWFYEQERMSYLDPQMAVRRKAEIRAQQRRARLSALKWYGLSNSRPTANVDPHHSDYANGWSGGNANYPFRWHEVGRGPSFYVSPYVSAVSPY